MNGDYYHSKDSVDEYIKMAEGFNGNELILKLKKHLKKGSTILELGSGPGSDWEILAADFKVTGSDNSIEFISRLKVKYPKGEFIEMDAAKLDTDKSFDAIYSNKVLHHLSDEDLLNSILKQSKVLKPGGYVGHSFWKGQGSEIFNGLFVNYHTGKEIEQMFGEFFTTILIEEYEEFEAGDSVFYIGQRKL